MAWNHTVRRFLQGNKGQGMAEYALIMMLIALAVLGTLGTLGESINQWFADANGRMFPG